MKANVADKRARKRSKYDGVPGKSKPECIHFWIIESPIGATSKGMCRYCGAVKEFMNEAPGLFYPGTFGQGEICDVGEDGQDEPS